MVFGLGGCSSYQLRGVVLEGQEAGIEVVGRDDPRLEYFGVAGTEVEVVADPQRLRPEVIGRGRADGDGGFAVPISKDGAGFLILDVEVRASRDGFRTTRQRFDLPGHGKRLIVTLARGEDRPSPDGGNILDDTLRDAEPYLRD